jgi:osmoprotectant transport system ATP-binding protein
MSQGAGTDIRIEGVAKTYGGHAALNEVSLSIPAGQFVALVGASGSGKTTLLKTINRLIVSDRGSVTVAGEDVAAAEPATLRRRIGYVFQGIGLFPHMTVGENIAVVPSLLGRPKDETAARVAELLALVDLPADYATRRPAELSGGQQQRVGVARALAARPKLMLMDEPFGALDPLTRDALGTAYRKLHDELGLTTVMVTHDMQEALLLADRIVVMKAGRVVADGAPRDLMAGHTDPEVEALIATPRRQAERLRALSDGEARHE